jgi:hypothetical protein
MCTTQWVFHMSGRRRFECSIEPPLDHSGRLTRLVLIGQDLDVEGLREMLARCVVESKSGLPSLPSSTVASTVAAESYSIPAVGF